MSERLIELRLEYGLPNVVDIGQGLFTRDMGLLFVDDDTGRSVAYVPPEVSKRADDEYVEQCEEEKGGAGWRACERGREL
ncbi:MAG TPA: hypothetical protein VEB21_02675 [Terriglobales bacterium]|nr:hypothetical protein [Terriglobales bacterium]